MDCFNQPLLWLCIFLPLSFNTEPTLVSVPFTLLLILTCFDRHTPPLTILSFYILASSHWPQLRHLSQHCSAFEATYIVWLTLSLFLYPIVSNYIWLPTLAAAVLFAFLSWFLKREGSPLVFVPVRSTWSLERGCWAEHLSFLGFSLIWCCCDQCTVLQHQQRYGCQVVHEHILSLFCVLHIYSRVLGDVSVPAIIAIPPPHTSDC